MINATKLFYLLLMICGILFTFFQTGNSLICYECNSHTDKNCSLKMPPEYLAKKCVKNDRNEYIICRKISQTIDFVVNGLPPDSRIIRSCAYESQEIDKCYQRSGFGGRQEVCACNKDYCNSSNIKKLNYGVFLISSLSLCVVNFSVRS